MKTLKHLLPKKPLSNHSLLFLGGLLLFYLAITILITWPLIFRMSSSLYALPSSSVDALGIIWDFWWQKFSYIKGMPSFPNFYVNAPEGVDISKGMIMLSWFFYGKWMSFWTNEVFAYNFINFISFPLSGLAMYALSFYLLKNRWLSVLCGFIFAFCPFHIAHALTRNGLAAIQWIPLAVLYLFKTKENPVLRNIFFYSLFIALNFYFEPHFGIFCLIFSGSYIFFLALKRKYLNLKSYATALKMSCIAGILTFILILPCYYIMIFNFLNPPASSVNRVQLGFERSLTDAQLQSAHILNYILPSVHHPVFGTVTESFLNTPLYGRAALTQELTLYLGIFVLIFAFIAFRRRKQIYNTSYHHKEVFQFLVFAAVLSFILSLPPNLNLGFVNIPFPSLLVHKVLPPVRAFARFGIYTLLFLTLIAGYGMKLFLQAKSKKQKLVYIILFFFIVAFEYLPVPPIMNYDLNSPMPAAYKWISAQPGDFIIADYPISQFNNTYQREHQKRLFNSHIRNEKILIKELKAKDLSQPIAIKELKRAGVKYLVINRKHYMNEIGYNRIQGVLPDFDQIQGIKLIENFKIHSIYEVIKND